MEQVLRVRLTVRKYLWKEFVYDVVYVTYATLVISNALSKRYLKLSLRQLLAGFYKAFQWGLLISFIGGWIYLLIRG